MPNADALLAALAAHNHGVFNWRQARETGLSPDQIRRRLREGRWIAIHEYVYRFAGAPVTWRGNLLAACWAGGIRAVASHRSAARLWGLPGGREDVAEITCPRWRRARHDKVLVHETKALDPVDLTFVDGIPTTGPERTLLDQGAVCSPTVVELALENGLRRELFTIESLREIRRRLGRQGRNGAGVLRRLLAERDPEASPTGSEMETRLLQVLRRNGLPAPITQYNICDGPRFVARVDAAYPKWKIAIEYESYQEHTGKLALLRDNPRRNALVALGWKPIGVTAEDIAAGGLKVATDIRRAADRDGGFWRR